MIASFNTQVNDKTKNDKPVETEYMRNFENLEKQIYVNEATSKIMEQTENMSVNFNFRDTGYFYDK